MLWTRIYSLLFLTLLLTWSQSRHTHRFTYTSVRLWRSHLSERGKPPVPGLFSSPVRLGLVLAGAAGVVENAGVLLYSVDTLVAQTGVSAVMASNYSLVALLFGCLALRERLTRPQFMASDWCWEGWPLGNPPTGIAHSRVIATHYNKC